jgi:hypothetical protein
VFFQGFKVRLFVAFFNSHQRLVFSAFLIKTVLEPSLDYFYSCELLLHSQAFYSLDSLASTCNFSQNSLQSKMARDGNDSDGLGNAQPALWEARLSKADER